jgi:hypothetical protein
MQSFLVFDYNGRFENDDEEEEGRRVVQQKQNKKSQKSNRESFDLKHLNAIFVPSRGRSYITGVARLFCSRDDFKNKKYRGPQKLSKKLLPVLSPKQAKLRCFPTKLCPKLTSAVHLRGCKKRLEGRSLAMSAI